MSVQLANGETVLKSYDYASVTRLGAKSQASSNNITVTNRRVIHSRTSKGPGSEAMVVEEIPIEYANNVQVGYSSSRRTSLLVWGILMICTIVGIIPGIISIVMFFINKKNVFVCAIQSNCMITPVMGISIGSANFATQLYGSKKADSIVSALTFTVDVKVNREVVKAMSEELGATILEAVSTNA